MVTLFSKTYSREELKQRYGDVSQLGGARLITLEDGPGRGARLVEVRTGTGFRFVIAADRGMDISEAEHAGRSLCWRSCTGDRHPGLFQFGGNEWLRHFYGGLVLTCGLTQAGAPCTDSESGESLGIHGRYTALPAEQLRIEQGWNGDEFEIAVTGTMRDSIVFFENIVMQRTIRTRLGANSFTIEDRVENAGYQPAPFMLLYHCNFGFPVLDEGTRLALAAKTVQPRDPEAERGVDSCFLFPGPVSSYREQVYFYDTIADDDGMVNAALYNAECEEGFGAYLRFGKAALPWFTQWKMVGQGNYTCGLEPANCLPLGREGWRNQGHLRTLMPGDCVVSNLELGALVGQPAIDECVSTIDKIAAGAGVDRPSVIARFCDDDIGR